MSGESYSSGDVASVYRQLAADETRHLYVRMYARAIHRDYVRGCETWSWWWRVGVWLEGSVTEVAE